MTNTYILNIQYHFCWFGWNIFMITSSNFPRNWPFVRGSHCLPVNSPHKGQWREALMLSFICAWINGWINNREAGDLRRHRAHYDVIVMWNPGDIPWYSLDIPVPGHHSNAVFFHQRVQVHPKWYRGRVRLRHNYPDVWPANNKPGYEQAKWGKGLPFRYVTLAAVAGDTIMIKSLIATQ